MARLAVVAVVAVAMVCRPTVVTGQPIPPSIARERAEFASWLKTAVVSPFRALVQHPIGPAIRLGPASAEVPLPGVDAAIEQRGSSLTLVVGGATRPLPRDRVIALGSYQILAAGLPGQAVVTVFDAKGKPAVAPTYYPYGGSWRMEVGLTAIQSATTERMLAPEGVEVEATQAGTVTVTVGGKPVTLKVFRIPIAGGEESELEIFFRDGTNGKTTYPAGRFVNLIPASGDHYLLDFNRARNPFCGYNTVFPCPAPWRGNIVPLPIPAGELYGGAPTNP